MNYKKNAQCACKIMQRLGPPPVFGLGPPPMPPLPIYQNGILITNPKVFDSFLKCSNKSVSTITANQMTNSYFLITTIIIIVLIVFLVFFILTAFLIVYITRLKLKNSNLNQSKNSCQSSNKQVSVLTLTSPSFTQISSSPNSTGSYTGSSEEPNSIFEKPKQPALSSFSKMMLNENTFKPIQMISSVSSASSASPNIDRESMDTNKTTSTILTQSKTGRIQKHPVFLQSENQHHYYESIGDVSQLYFDVDDQNFRRNLARCAIPEASEVACPIRPCQQQHFPITCCSCTLINYNQQNLAHSCSNPIRNSQFNLNTSQYFYDNSRDVLTRFNQSSSNLNSSNYLKSLLV